MNKILVEFYSQSNISSPHSLLPLISSLLFLKRTPIYKKLYHRVNENDYLVHERSVEVSLQSNNKNRKLKMVV